MSRLTHPILAPLVAIAGVVALACATTAEFEKSEVVPAAAGKVKVSVGPSGNTRVSVDFEHLAPPTRLNPPRAFYLVWAQSDFGRNALLGQLTVDDKLRAEFEGPVPFQRFRLFVTGEEIATPQWPSPPPYVLATGFLTSKGTE